MSTNNIPPLVDSSDSGRTTVVVRQKKRKTASKERPLTTPRSVAKKNIFYSWEDRKREVKAVEGSRGRGTWKRSPCFIFCRH
jgi:hypothetical protein